MLGADCLLIGAAAMFYRKWGSAWPLHVRCCLWPADDSSIFKPSNHPLHPLNAPKDIQVPDPELGVCFLSTPTHWMIHASTERVALGCDGYTDYPPFRKLADQATREMSKFGFHAKCDFPQFWNQKDGTSCGYHCLQFLKTILFQNLLEPNMWHDYKPNLHEEWGGFAEMLMEWVHDMGWKLPDAVDLISEESEGMQLDAQIQSNPEDLPPHP